MRPPARHEVFRRVLAATLALGLISEHATAACAHAQAASPFPEVPIVTEEPPSYAWAYVALGSGVAMVGGSFMLSERADRSYQDYLASTQPGRIESLYDRTVMYDRVAGSALVAGELLLATGIYLRFVRRPRAARLSLDLGPQRCALAYRF